MNKKGQATSEIALMVPLFVMLAVGAISITYMCWQGIKVQQAANLAARIQGQERVAGGYAPASNPALGVQYINEDNGIDGGGDKVPDEASFQQLSNDPNALSGFKTKPTGGVYGKFYQAVHDMFGPGEQAKLFVPPPIHQGINTDTVEVVRILNPLKFMDFKMSPIRLEATAYGGEDSHMYALPRWGRSQGSTQPFYQSQITNPENK